MVACTKYSTIAKKTFFYISIIAASIKRAAQFKDLISTKSADLLFNMQKIRTTSSVCTKIVLLFWQSFQKITLLGLQKESNLGRNVEFPGGSK